VAPLLQFFVHARSGFVVSIGEVPEWPKGTDCKSVGVSLRRFETSPPHHFMKCGLMIAECGLKI
jgi:hypothetical protein